MPTYDYQCQECKDHFTAIKRISEGDVPCQAPCKSCGLEGTVKRVMLVAPLTVSGVGNPHEKIPSGFKDVLKNIHKSAGKGSTIDV